MKIQVTISDQIGRDVIELQKVLGLENIEDLTIHAWNVLRYLQNNIRHGHCTLSPEAVHWISQPTLRTSSKESLQETPAFSHQKIDTRILEEIHRLLDGDHIDQALKVTHILKILRSDGIESPETQQVKTEMLLTAAETFAAEGDPEHAAQLISDATKETGGNT